MKILLLMFLYPCFLAAESSDASEQQQLKEAISRRLDAIKSKIKHEIKRRAHVRETEVNNHKYEGPQCADKDDVKKLDIAKEKTEEADSKIRRKRDRDDDEIKQNLKKIQEEDDFLRKLGDANNDSAGVVSDQPDFLFKRENNSQAPSVAASRTVRKRNVDRDFSKHSRLRRRRRSRIPIRQRRHRRRQRRPVKLEPVVNVVSSRFKRV